MNSPAARGKSLTGLAILRRPRGASLGCVSDRALALRAEPEEQFRGWACVRVGERSASPARDFRLAAGEFIHRPRAVPFARSHHQPHASAFARSHHQPHACPFARAHHRPRAGPFARAHHRQNPEREHARNTPVPRRHAPRRVPHVSSPRPANAHATPDRGRRGAHAITAHRPPRTTRRSPRKTPHTWGEEQTRQAARRRPGGGMERPWTRAADYFVGPLGSTGASSVLPGRPPPRKVSRQRSSKVAKAVRTLLPSGVPARRRCTSEATAAAPSPSALM